MTDLEHRIRELLLEYLSGAIQLDVLRERQIELQLKAEADKDAGALDVLDQVELVLAEFSNGHRTEQSVRSEIQTIVSFVHSGA